MIANTITKTIGQAIGNSDSRQQCRLSADMTVR